MSSQIKLPSPLNDEETHNEFVEQIVFSAAVGAVDAADYRETGTFERHLHLQVCREMYSQWLNALRHVA